MAPVATSTEAAPTSKARHDWWLTSPRVPAALRWITATQVTAALGVILVGGGLIVPWLGMPLEPEKRSTSLRLVFAGMPTASWATYGSVVGAVLAVAIAGAVAARFRSSSLVAAAGAVAVLLPLVFVAQSVLTDYGLLQHLRQQQTELASATGQFGYSEPGSSVTSVFLIPLSGPWRAMATQLRPGWFLCVAGGVLLVVSGARAAREQLRRRRVVAGTTIVLGVLLLLMVRGVAANLVANSAQDPLRAGDYDTTVSRLDLAEQLNPDLRLSPDEELARGQALASGGNRASAPALLYISRVRAGSGDQPGALLALREGVQSSPDDVVLQAELVQRSRTLALRSNDPGPLEFVLSTSFGQGLVAEHYALGRILYARADYQPAILQLRRAAEQSGPDPNVASSALTYIALCEMRLGQGAQARHDLLQAVALDTEYINSLARSLATGLYTTGPN